MAKNIIIIGAPRSGTNMLRDMLVRIDKVDTWPCDEINYIWRHGNIGFSSDQFSTKEARPDVIRYINRQFCKFQKKSGCHVVIEKTCASSLRVEFINAVLPTAKYINIIRDGVDCVASAKLRWTASLDIRYILKKAKYVPLVDLPFYGVKYLSNRISRFFSKEKRLAYWGPTLSNMPEILANNTLMGVCAVQWKACVNNASKALSNLDSSKVLNVRYEEFVANPEVEFVRIAKFIGKNPSDEDLEYIKSKVSVNSVGKGRESMTTEEYKDVMSIISDDLKKLGYESDY